MSASKGLSVKERVRHQTKQNPTAQVAPAMIGRVCKQKPQGPDASQFFQVSCPPSTPRGLQWEGQELENPDAWPEEPGGHAGDNSIVIVREAEIDQQGRLHGNNLMVYR